MAYFKMGAETYNRPLNKVVAVIPECYMDWKGPAWTNLEHSRDFTIDRFIQIEVVDWLQQYECIVYSLIYHQHSDLITSDTFLP